MITADQLVAHAVGDYLLQSDWMAQRKTRSSVAATVHALIYSLVFVVWFRPSLAAWALIYGTHYVIDRWRLARFVVWAKNFMAPRGRVATTFLPEWHRLGEDSQTTVRHREWWVPWTLCSKTGYPDSRPEWLSVWLLIIADNVLHVLINGAALRWLP